MFCFTSLKSLCVWVLLSWLWTAPTSVSSWVSSWPSRRRDRSVYTPRLRRYWWGSSRAVRFSIRAWNWGRNSLDNVTCKKTQTKTHFHWVPSPTRHGSHADINPKNPVKNLHWNVCIIPPLVWSVYSIAPKMHLYIPSSQWWNWTGPNSHPWLLRWFWSTLVLTCSCSAFRDPSQVSTCCSTASYFTTGNNHRLESTGHTQEPFLFWPDERWARPSPCCHTWTEKNIDGVLKRFTLMW